MRLSTLPRAAVECSSPVARLLGAQSLLSPDESPLTDGNYILLRDGCSVWVWPMVATLTKELAQRLAAGGHI